MIVSNQNCNAKEILISALEDKLNLLGILNDLGMKDDCFEFKSNDGKYSITLDWSIFSLPHVAFTDSVPIVFQGQKLELSIKEFAKLIWVELCAGRKTNHTYLCRYEGIVKLFAYLKENKLTCLNLPSLESFFCFYLTCDVDKEGIQSRISVPAFTSGLCHFTLHKLSQIMRPYKSDFLIAHVSKNKAVANLNQACQHVMGMSLADYKKGGSFNKLGLDIGRHYIDHCANVFEENFQSAAAFRIFLESDCTELLEELSLCLKQSNNHVLKAAVGYALTGGTMSKGYFRGGPTWTDRKLAAIAQATYTRFQNRYNSLAHLARAFNLDTISSIIERAKLPERFDSQEFVRSIILTQFAGVPGKTALEIYEEYSAVLAHEEVCSVLSFDDFIELVEQVIDSSKCVLPNDDNVIRKHLLACANTFQTNDETDPVGFDLVKYFCLHVESAGATLFVALTGWRSSEFGFPLSSIKASINTEILDNLYTPWRFHVSWVVPKTSKTTPLDREITQYCYQLSYLLNVLNCSDSILPCLYKSLSSKNIDASNVVIQHRVSKLWPDFVRNYDLFKKLDKLGSSNQNLSSEIIDLLSMREQLRDALPRFLLFSDTNKNNSLSKYLEEYHNGSLKPEIVKMFESRLSSDTLARIIAGDFKFNSISDIRYIRNELLQEDVYPTAHAFRHIWAEAVLRRYRGDVGKFIRANFKHLDERYFIAYLRDKETQAVYEVAKRTVINSIVRHHIKTLADSSREYAGEIDAYLSKAVRLTKVVSLEEYEELANRIATDRVIDIKSNPWSTCILMVNTESLAKCSVDGIPQRHNAEPKLCLGCVNADIYEGNFIGIVVYLQHDVRACRNGNLPYMIKQFHIETVRLGLKRIKQLKKNSQRSSYDKYIAFLQETIEIAESGSAEGA